jgi:hypothetical protein
MKLKTVITVATAWMLTAGMAKAVHIWEDPGAWSGDIFKYDTTTPKYTANELSLDLSGSYIAAEGEFHDVLKTSIRGNRGTWGGNAGLDYFFTRMLGVGGDINMSANGGRFIDQALGSVILRFPLDPTGLAPYIMGGGGRSFDPSWEWLGHAGAGLEYRFNPVTGIFADARFIWADHSDNRLLLRAGLRLAF